jgi:hypothetical protein
MVQMASASDESHSGGSGSVGDAVGGGGLMMVLPILKVQMILNIRID